MKKGLAWAKELYEHRGQRAKELKAQGKKIIGYFCCYPPLEMITAVGAVPYRIQGSMREAITQADAYLESIMCPFMRSCFDKALKGDYGFLDGLVVPHSCDTVQRIYDIWREYNKVPYSHFINVPHMLHPSSYEFFQRELEQFKKSLEGFMGKEINAESLNRAIKVHNENRALLRQLYELRKPPLISGTEVLQILVAGMTLPVEEFNQLLQQSLEEVKLRSPLPPKPRILVYGSETDDIAFVELVEECGALVVMDDLCTGSRTFWEDVVEDGHPVTRLAKRYLEKIPCPRTYRPRYGSYNEDLEYRFKYLMDFIHHFQVHGVIFYIIRYCDTHEFDVPSLRDYLEESQVPVLHLEDEYSLFTVGQLRTRIQAFLETIT